MLLSSTSRLDWRSSSRPMPPNGSSLPEEKNEEAELLEELVAISPQVFDPYPLELILPEHR